jgi:SPP1 gp7 family putative phage head morphogenesis protein
MRNGRVALESVLRPAIIRALQSNGPDLPAHLFSDAEMHRLTEAIAGANAAADLLGRARVRELATGVPWNSKGPRRFAEFRAFADAPVPPLSPEAALEYFRALVPTLGVDPQRYGRDMRRAAFTLAEATEQTLIERVQNAIADVLEQGTGPEGLAGEEVVQQLLDAAGVTPTNPQYAEMVFRTNAADAYNTGAWDEYTDPDLQDEFPVWQYSNPADARSRPHHAARDGNYYPASMSFAEVRGTDAGDVIQCRCVFIPVHKSEWKQLEAAGARLAA